MISMNPPYISHCMSHLECSIPIVVYKTMFPPIISFGIHYIFPLQIPLSIPSNLGIISPYHEIWCFPNGSGYAESSNHPFGKFVWIFQQRFTIQRAGGSSHDELETPRITNEQPSLTIYSPYTIHISHILAIDLFEWKSPYLPRYSPWTKPQN